MIIEKDTMLLVRHKSRGEFTAKARRSFSLDDDSYPLTVVDPMDARCIRGEEILPRAAATFILLLEEELSETAAEDITEEPETEPTEPYEEETEITEEPHPESRFANGGGIASFQLFTES